MYYKIKYPNGMSEYADDSQELIKIQMDLLHDLGMECGVHYTVEEVLTVEERNGNYRN